MTSSDQKTASAQIITGAGLLHGIIISPTADGAGTVDLHDGTDATGKRLIPQITLVAASNGRMQIDFSNPVSFQTGCYLAITATAGTINAVVYAEKK